MAIETTTLTGDIGTLTGADPTNCRVRLTLTESATDQVTGEIITAGSITEQAASDGTFSIVAWPNDRAPTDRAFYTFEVLVGSDVVYARQKLIIPTTPDPCTLGHVIDISEHLVAPKNLAFTQTLDALSGSEQAGDEVGTLYADGDYFIDWDLVEGRQYFQLGTDGASIALKSVPPFGTYTVRVRARNIAGEASQTFVFTLGAAPEAFAVGDWSVAAARDTSGDKFTITLAAIPSGNGEAITRIDYRLDGGAWVSLGRTTVGSATITGAAFTTYDVELRAANAIGDGAASDTKSVTTAYSQPSPFTAGQWSIADAVDPAGDVATVTITALPDAGVSAITALQASVDGGAWAALGGTTTGAYSLTVPAFTAGTEVQVRAVSVEGNGLASDTKIVDTRQVPAAFTAGQWSTAAGQELATITVTALPAANGAVITDLQGRVDGGAWTSLGGAVTGTYSLAAASGAPRDIEIRAVNAIGAGAESDIKTVTPSSGYVLTLSEPPLDPFIVDSGAARGANAADVPVVAGTTDAPDGTQVEARLIRADTEAVVHDWTTCTGTVSGGAFDGLMVIPTGAKSQHELLLEARPLGSGQTPDRMTAKVCIGHVIVGYGQSEMDRITGLTAAGTRTLTTNDRVRMSKKSGLSPASTMLNGATVGVNSLGGQGSVAIANALLNCAPNDFFHYASFTESATGPSQMINDALGGRVWEHEEALFDLITWGKRTDPGLMVWGWWHEWVSDAQDGIEVIAPLFAGVDPSGTPVTIGGGTPYSYVGPGNTYTFDHAFTEFWDFTKTKVAFWSYTENETSAQNAYSYQTSNGAVLDADRLVREHFRSVVVNNASISPLLAGDGILRAALTHTYTETGDGTHPDYTEDGLPQFGSQMAYGIAEKLGILPVSMPEFTVDAWTTSQITLGVNSGTISTVGAEDGDTPLGSALPHHGQVVGFTINGQVVDGGATISGNTIVITPRDADFDGADVLEYHPGTCVYLDATDRTTHLPQRFLPIAVHAGITDTQGLNFEMDQIIANPLAAVDSWTLAANNEFNFVPVGTNAISDTGQTEFTFAADLTIGDGADRLADYINTDLYGEIMNLGGASGVEIHASARGRFRVRVRDGAGTTVADQYTPYNTWLPGYRCRIVVAVDMVANTVKAWADGIEVINAALSANDSSFFDPTALKLGSNRATAVPYCTFRELSFSFTATTDGTDPTWLFNITGNQAAVSALTDLYNAINVV